MLQSEIILAPPPNLLDAILQRRGMKGVLGVSEVESLRLTEVMVPLAGEDGGSGSSVDLRMEE